MAQPVRNCSRCLIDPCGTVTNAIGNGSLSAPLQSNGDLRFAEIRGYVWELIFELPSSIDSRT